MNFVRRLLVRGVRSGVALACVITLAVVVSSAGVATAADADKKEDEKSHEYTIPYFITGVCVLLAVIPVCWPAHRRWDLPLHDEE